MKRQVLTAASPNKMSPSLWRIMSGSEPIKGHSTNSTPQLYTVTVSLLIRPLSKSTPLHLRGEILYFLLHYIHLTALVTSYFTS